MSARNGAGGGNRRPSPLTVSQAALGDEQRVHQRIKSGIGARRHRRDRAWDAGVECESASHCETGPGRLRGRPQVRWASRSRRRSASPRRRRLASPDRTRVAQQVGAPRACCDGRRLASKIPIDLRSTDRPRARTHPARPVEFATTVVASPGRLAQHTVVGRAASPRSWRYPRPHRP